MQAIITVDEFGVETKENIKDVEVLMLKGEKGDIGYPTDAQVAEAVDDWLDDHPEATTTVQDKSIGAIKLTDALYEQILNAYPTESLSNQAVASFTDGAKNIPVKSLSVAITPIQNLNGQTSPYPAGGGKNKYSGGDVTVTEALLANVVVDLIPAGTYTLSGIVGTDNTLHYVRVAFRKADGTGIDFANLPYANGGRGSVSFTLTEECSRIYFYWGAGTSGTGNQTYKDIQIESGSTATAYAPYSNICPITGWTGANVRRTGVNLFNKNAGVANNKRIATSTGGTYTSSGYTVSPYVRVFEGVKYTLTSGISSYCAYYDRNKTFISGSGSTWATGTAQTVPSGAYYVRFDFKTDDIDTVQFEVGASASAYKAYEGQDYLTDWGINQWDEEWEVGAYNTSTGAKTTGNNVRSKNYIPCQPDTTYFEHDTSATTARAVVMCYYDASKTFISAATNTTNSTFKTPTNAYFMTFYCGAAYGTTYNNDISINFPSSDHAYHAYADPHVGFCYGGSLDVISSVLTVTHGVKVLDGTETWRAFTASNYYGLARNDGNAFMDDFAVSGSGQYAIPKLSHFKGVPYMVGADMPDMSSCTFVGNYGKTITVKDSNIADADAMKAFCLAQYNAGTPVTFVLPLATPITVQLSATEVTTLLGQNNIWADTGDVTDVTIRCDTALYIQKMIANALNA